MNKSKTLLTAAVVASLSTLPTLSVAVSTPAPSPTSQATNNCCHAKKSKSESGTVNKAAVKKTNSTN